MWHEYEITICRGPRATFLQFKVSNGRRARVQDVRWRGSEVEVCR